MRGEKEQEEKEETVHIGKKLEAIRLAQRQFCRVSDCRARQLAESSDRAPCWTIKALSG